MSICVSVSSAAIVSSEQNPVIIIAVVAVAGTIILVFMVFGFIIGRRYALAGPIDSPLLWVCACQLAFLSLTGLHLCGVITCTHTCTHHLMACCANGLLCIRFFPVPSQLHCETSMRPTLQSGKALALASCVTLWRRALLPLKQSNQLLLLSSFSHILHFCFHLHKQQCYLACTGDIIRISATTTKQQFTLGLKIVLLPLKGKLQKDQKDLRPLNLTYNTSFHSTR